MAMRITREQIRELEAPTLAAHRAAISTVLGEQLARPRIDAEKVIDEVARFSVAAPSWAVGTGGTRFGRFPRGGEPRTTEEKLDDIAALNAVTGANRTVSLHVPWDDPRDPQALRAHAGELGIAFDAMNSNTFQDNPSTTGDGEVSYKFGSLAHSNPDVRKRALEHNRAVIDLGVQLGSDRDHRLDRRRHQPPWPGDFRDQFERVADGLHELHDDPSRGLGALHRAQTVRTRLLLERQRRLGNRHSCSRRPRATTPSASSTSDTTFPAPTSSRS